MSIFARFSFGKKDESQQPENQNKDEKKALSRDWYYDRYEGLIVQRNILFVFAILAIIASMVSVFYVSKVTMSKNIEAMVIEVEDKSGITNIVNPATDNSWTANKVMAEYFLTMYLRARETYNVVNFTYNYNTAVRLLSTMQVYTQFKEYINNPSVNPVTKYANNNSTILQIRSIQHLENSPNGDHNAQIRFSVIETAGNKNQYNKIVSILWNYTTMQMNYDDRMVNPLGFQVKFYSVADDVS